jgi:hypothetical protein
VVGVSVFAVCWDRQSEPSQFPDRAVSRRGPAAASRFGPKCPGMGRKQALNRRNVVAFLTPAHGVRRAYSVHTLRSFAPFFLRKSIMPNPLEVRFVSLNMTPEIGSNDCLVAVRIVPDGRDGSEVYGRTLKAGEVDPEIPVIFDPDAGEELHLRPGSVQITIQDVDRMAKSGPDGYATITNTVWTWLSIGAPTAPTLFRFLLSASRRLDTAHSLYTQVELALGSLSGSYPHQREQAFAALGFSELLCVALGRAIEMFQQIPTKFSVDLQLPATINGKARALREIRNAFEHIEDRALGKVRGKTDADALSIFDQRDLFSRGVLTYASHSLSLHSEVLPMLVHARRTAFETAVQVSGPAVILNAGLAWPAVRRGIVGCKFAE